MKEAKETAVVVEKTRRRYLVSERGPRSFALLDTNEVDEHEQWLVVDIYGSKRLANAVAKDREARAAEMGR